MNYLYFTWLQYLAQERQNISKTHLPWFFPSSLDVCLIYNIGCRHAGHDRQSADQTFSCFPNNILVLFLLLSSLVRDHLDIASNYFFFEKLCIDWYRIHILRIVSTVFLPEHFIYYINKYLQIVNTIYLKLAILFKWSWISISSKWTSPHFY